MSGLFSRSGLLRLLSVWHLLILLIILIVLFALLKPDTFLTAFTFRSIANSRSINALVALAVMIPLAANQFDLSAASVLGIAQVLANGLQTQQGLPWPLAVVLVVLMGAAVGFVNGTLVTRFGSTPSSRRWARARCSWASTNGTPAGARWWAPLATSFPASPASLPGIGIPAPLLYVLVIGLVLWVVFDYLPAGRYLYVIGDNPRAAVLSGISAPTAASSGPSSPRARSPPSPASCCRPSSGSARARSARS